MSRWARCAPPCATSTHAGRASASRWRREAMTQTAIIPITQLGWAAWLRAWSALPAERRSTYYHPDYVAAAARWEGGAAECLRLGDEDCWLLYPYVRHAIP